MKITPATSNARWIAASVTRRGTEFFASNWRAVTVPRTLAALARSSCDQRKAAVGTAWQALVFNGAVLVNLSPYPLPGAGVVTSYPGYADGHAPDTHGGNLGFGAPGC